MTTVHQIGAARPYAGNRSGSRGSVLAQAIDTFRRWFRMRRALSELRELDDRLLDDIGLSRSTLYATARERHGLRKRGFRAFEG